MSQWTRAILVCCLQSAQTVVIREGKSDFDLNAIRRSGSYINSEVGFKNGGFLERAAEYGRGLRI
jgi:hypothetical protein